MLLNKSFRALPVVNEANKVVGIVTDGDIFTKGGAPFRLDHLQALAGDPVLLTQTLDTFRANAKTVAEIMSTPVVTLSRNESLVEAAKLMNTWHLKRLPVVDGEGKLVGLLSRFDLLQASLKQPRITGDDNVSPVPQLKINAYTLVDEIITGDFPRILEDATLSEALSRLMAARQHRAVVVNQQGKAIGVITESDMISRVGQQTRTGILQGLRRKLGLSTEEFALNLTTNKVSNIVQGRLISIPAGARLSHAVELMAQEKVKILPVLDEAGRPLGVLTRRIILQALLHAAEQ
jgi:CBS domain-containing protein